MNNKLFVGNLSFQTSEIALEDAFKAHGDVTEVNLMVDKMTGRSRGFAFVTMASDDAAQAAIAALHGQQLDGRALTVNVARPREERSGGGGGGFRGGGVGGGGGGYRGGGGGGGGGGYRGGGGGGGRGGDRGGYGGGDRY
jgi:RNA recognition motif-containing protein